MFTQRQLEMVMTWRLNGASIQMFRREGQLEVYADRDDQLVLLFVVDEEQVA